jgi:hypothetical protein
MTTPLILRINGRMFKFLPGKDTYNMSIIKEEKAEPKPCLYKIDYLKRIYNSYSLTSVDMG